MIWRIVKFTHGVPRTGHAAEIAAKIMSYLQAKLVVREEDNKGWNENSNGWADTLLNLIY